MLRLTVFAALLVQVAARCPEPAALPNTMRSGGKDVYMCARLYEKSNKNAVLSQCDTSGRTLNIANGESRAEYSGNLAWLKGGVKGAVVVRPGCTLDIYRFSHFKLQGGPFVGHYMPNFPKVSLTTGKHQLEDGKTKKVESAISSTTLSIPTSSAFGGWKMTAQGHTITVNENGGSFQCYCNRDNKALQCNARDAFVVINDCDNTYGHGVMQCVFSISSGVTKTSSSSNSKNTGTTISSEVGVTIAKVVSAKIGISHTTGYTWSTSNSHALSKSESTAVTCQVPKGKRSQLQQVQAFCGEYTVSTKRWRCIDTNDPKYIKKTKEDACFHKNKDIAVRNFRRCEKRDTAKACQQWCQGTHGCTHFVWVSDIYNGIHGTAARKNCCLKSTSSNAMIDMDGVIVGPKACPLYRK